MATDMYGLWITVLELNPEPWAAGTTFAGRKGGQIKSGMSPNEKLVTYKKALGEELLSRDLVIDDDEKQLYVLHLLFKRQVDSYLTPTGRHKTGNFADVTNLQKATEDALQGVLLHNDRQVVGCSSILIDQGKHVEPFIGICVQKVGYDFLTPYEKSAEGLVQAELLRIVREGDGPSW